MSTAKTKEEYRGDGSQKDFTFDFVYHEKSDVKVSLYDDTTDSYLIQTFGTDWDFKNETTVRFVTAPPVSPISNPDEYGYNNILI